MAELTVSVAKAIAEGQGATAWEIYQLARAFLHEHGMESPPYVEPAALSHAAGQDGEQCRAASGEVTDEVIAAVRAAHSVDRVSNGELMDSIAGRHYGDKLLRGIITTALRALSRGVPEGEPSRLLCWAFDNLNDMPISEEWAAEWCKQAEPLVLSGHPAIAAQQPILGVTGGTDEGWGS